MADPVGNTGQEGGPQEMVGSVEGVCVGCSSWSRAHAKMLCSPPLPALGAGLFSGEMAPTLKDQLLREVLTWALPS